MQTVAFLWNRCFHDVKTWGSAQYHLGSTNLENQIFAATEYKLLFVRHMDRKADLDGGLVDRKERSYRYAIWRQCFAFGLWTSGLGHSNFLLSGRRRFGRTCHLHIQSQLCLISNLQMWMAAFPKTSVTSHKCKGYQNPDVTVWMFIYIAVWHEWSYFEPEMVCAL